MSDCSDDDYEIGYKRPPKHSRFKPGQSGNPRGRPRKEMHFATSFRKKLGQSISVKKNGCSHQMTVVEATCERLVSALLQGTISDLIKVMQAIERYAPEQLRPLPTDMCMRVTYVASDHPEALKPPPAHRLPPHMRGNSQED